LHQRRGGVVEPVPDRVPRNRSARVHAAGEAVRAAGVMPEREVLAPLMSRLAEGELYRASEAGSGVSRHGQERSRASDVDTSDAMRRNVPVADDDSGNGVSQIADSRSSTDGAGRVYLNGVIELLDSDSEARKVDGAVAAPSEEAPDSDEFPMLEYSDSDLQQIDERVSESQNSGKT